MQIDFSFDTQYGKFADALHFEDDAIPSDAEIEAMKQQRLDNWIAVLTSPPPNYLLDAEGNVVLDADGNPVISE